MSGQGFPVHYFGLLRQSQVGETRSDIASAVYNMWDNSPESPPKQRPTEETTSPNFRFEILAMQDGRPKWPTVLDQKFPSDSTEHKELMAIKAELLAKFPGLNAPAASTSRAATAGSGARSEGSCDYTVDDGKRPLDHERMIELQAVPVADMNVQRLLGEY